MKKRKHHKYFSITTKGHKKVIHYIYIDIYRLILTNNRSCDQLQYMGMMKQNRLLLKQADIQLKIKSAN